MLVHPFDITADGFSRACAGVRGGRPAALAAYRRFYRGGRLELAGFEEPAHPRVVREQRESGPEGETIKFALAVAGVSGSAGAPELETESVLIPMIGKKQHLTHTLCVSSQVGCAMGCGFCQTARMGLVRSLTPGEIVAQWFAAAHGFGVVPRNIVFMGMGEPMDNLASVVGSIEILTDHHGPAHPMSRITVSTVGRIDGIRALAERVRTHGWRRLNLAVSINAANDATRSSLMPINRAMPMSALRQALAEWPLFGGAKICLEYVLIPGVNDSASDARELAAWARGIPACVNVIPYNPRDESPWSAPDEASVDRFLAELIAHDTFVKRRRTKGRSLMGACGQLGNPQLHPHPRTRRRRFVDATIGAISNPAGEA